MSIYFLKNIEEVFKRTNAVQLATGDQCLNYGDSVSSDLGPAEEPVLSAKRYWSNLSLKMISIDRHLWVREKYPKPLFAFQGIGCGFVEFVRGQ